MPTNDVLVSACMIVRDEEDFLEGCLRSIEGSVDEIVIGDTGSTDRSPEIARDFGARFYHIPWTDDFSAVRNQVLDQAKGAWILSIDADERLRPIPRSRIELFLNDPTNIAYYVLMHPLSRWTGVWVIRLFRNDPRIRFKGIFHEALHHGLEKARSIDTKEIGFSEIVLDHLGYDRDQRGKLSRNLLLLLKEIERDPNNGYTWSHLGLVYEELGEDVLAEDAWKRAIEIVKKKRGSDICSYIYYIEWRLRHGQSVQELLIEAMNLSPDNPYLYWIKGRLLMDEGRYDKAIPFFENLVLWGKTRDFEMSSMSYPLCLFDVHAYDSLATCHFRLGDYPESGKYFHLAENLAPETMEYKVKKQLCQAMMKPS